MKRLLRNNTRKFALVVFGVGLGTAAPALAAPVSWQGEFMVTATTGPCPSVQAGHFAAARFRPGIGGENGSDSYLTLFGKREARGYKLAGNLFGNAYLEVATMFVGDVFAPFTITPVEIRFTSQTPDPVNALTVFIDIKGKFRGYDAQPGCVVDFKLTLARRQG